MLPRRHNLFARLIPSFQIMLNGGADELEQYAAKVRHTHVPLLNSCDHFG